MISVFLKVNSPGVQGPRVSGAAKSDGPIVGYRYAVHEERSQPKGEGRPDFTKRRTVDQATNTR